MRESDIVWIILRTLTCFALTGVGGVVAIQYNLILGCLLSASGILAVAIPLIIENDNFINKQNER